MSSISVEIEIPDVVRGTPLEDRLRSVIARQSLENAVVELYEKQEISTGTGAKMLGMSLDDFIQFLGKHRVSIFNFDEDEWEAELQSVGQLNEQLESKGT